MTTSLQHDELVETAPMLRPTRRGILRGIALLAASAIWTGERAFLSIPVPLGDCSAYFIFAFLHSFEELTVAPFIGGGLRNTLLQMKDDVLLQVSPTQAAASVAVLLIVTGLFLIAEYVRRRG